MLRCVGLIFLLFFPLLGVAFPGELPIALEKVHIDTHNKASLLRGAKFFAKNCMSCHTMKYLRYNKLAQEAGITLDKMPLNIKEWWMGITPPDLTLIASQKGPNWLYTYFHAFYKDSSRPTGYNNLVMKDVNMMNVFVAFQGEQVLTERGKELLKNNHFFSTPHYYTALELVKSGSMTPEEFDRTMTDLVNFLVYASDPGKIHRENIGIWVLLFLGILAVLAYLLKKVYWEDVE